MVVADILDHDGCIILLGDPRFRVHWDGDDDEPHEAQFLWWTGLEFEWDDRGGESISLSLNQFEAKRFKTWLSHFRNYRYSLRNCEVDVESLGAYINLDDLENQGKSLRVRVQNLALNRHKASLAFIVRLVVSESMNHLGVYPSRPASERPLLGELVFLPRTDRNWDDAL